MIKGKSDAARLIQFNARATRGSIAYGGRRWPCAMGAGGVRAFKREGDGATPFGLWPLRCVLYRPDRLRRPRTCLPVAALRPQDGWCDAPGDASYNRMVAMPYRASAETLWREDGLYDLIVVIGYNDEPRVQGAGSAIFMHIARPGYAPTAGCVALRTDHLLALLEAPQPPGFIDTRG